MATKKIIPKKQFKLNKSSQIALFIFPLIVVTVWTLWPFAKIYWVMHSFDSSSINEATMNSLPPEDLKRNIQKYLLSWEIYVATSDMVSAKEFSTVDSSEAVGSTEYLEISQKEVEGYCGKGSIFVWIPVTIKIPLFGNVEKEICWTPKI